MNMPAEVYAQWLNNPVTKEVFFQMEQLARPQHLEERVTQDDAAYRLGYVTGFWDALDQTRMLVSGAPEEEVESTYGRPEDVE